MEGFDLILTLLGGVIGIVVGLAISLIVFGLCYLVLPLVRWLCAGLPEILEIVIGWMVDWVTLKPTDMQCYLSHIRLARKHALMCLDQRAYDSDTLI